MIMSWRAVLGWRQAVLIILIVLTACWAIGEPLDEPEIALEMGGTYENLHKRSSASFSPLIHQHVWFGIPATDARLRFIDSQYQFVTPKARFFTVGFDDNVIKSIRMSPQIEPLLLDDALKVALNLQDQWRQGGWRIAGPRTFPAFANTPSWRARLRDVNQGGTTYWQAGEKYQIAMFMNRFADSKRPNEERYLITLSIGAPWTPFDDE